MNITMDHSSGLVGAKGRRGGGSENGSVGGGESGGSSDSGAGNVWCELIYLAPVQVGDRADHLVREAARGAVPIGVWKWARHVTVELFGTTIDSFGGSGPTC